MFLVLVVTVNVFSPGVVKPQVLESERPSRL